MTAGEHRDAGNASGFGVSTRCAGSPLRFDPSDDTPNPEAWVLVMAGRGLPAMTDRLPTAKSKGDSRMRLTSIRPAGNYRLSRAQTNPSTPYFRPRTVQRTRTTSKNRYRHRRRMAYLALSGVLLSLAILFVIGLFRPESFEALDDSTVLIFIQGFLTSIVATYFGISAGSRLADGRNAAHGALKSPIRTR